MKLMIGDWVIFMSEQSAGFERVAAIDATGDRVKVTSEYGGGPYDVVDILPIPLTAEILEKNGFDISDKEVMQYHFEEDGEKYHFSLRQMYDKDGKPHGYSFYAFNVLTLLDYVHELQHALRLCDIDKTIEL